MINHFKFSLTNSYLPNDKLLKNEKCELLNATQKGVA